jgi:2-polyprenyl-6-methoxyphenol hydroxylase-like FAD-dependent oxidoreductase
VFVEVLVVGAGPAGSAVAAALASRGHEVLLVDRARFPRPKPCGEYMSPACDALLAELGVAAGLRRRGLHPHRRLVLRAPDGFGLSVSLDQLLAQSSLLSTAGARCSYSPRRHGDHGEVHGEKQA